MHHRTIRTKRLPTDLQCIDRMTLPTIHNDRNHASSPVTNPSSLLRARRGLSDIHRDSNNIWGSRISCRHRSRNLTHHTRAPSSRTSITRLYVHRGFLNVYPACAPTIRNDPHHKSMHRHSAPSSRLHAHGREVLMLSESRSHDVTNHLHNDPNHKSCLAKRSPIYPSHQVTHQEHPPSAMTHITKSCLAKRSPMHPSHDLAHHAHPPTAMTPITKNNVSS